MKAGKTLEGFATSHSTEKDIEILTSLKAFKLDRSWI